MKSSGVIFIFAAIVTAALIFSILVICENSKRSHNTFVRLDKCLFYDASTNKFIIKLPFKKSVFVSEELRKNHRPICLNHTTYEFYDDYVLINKNKIVCQKG